jgi:hypothetical protein
MVDTNEQAQGFQVTQIQQPAIPASIPLPSGVIASVPEVARPQILHSRIVQVSVSITWHYCD